MLLLNHLNQLKLRTEIAARLLPMDSRPDSSSSNCYFFDVSGYVRDSLIEEEIRVFNEGGRIELNKFPKDGDI